MSGFSFKRTFLSFSVITDITEKNFSFFANHCE
nr:MAG TPA: hypothetical protein [Caudoviricetes sp.]